MIKLPPAYLNRPIAHRGLHDADHDIIENSRTAFKSALEAGYGIELDVQMSADEQAIVFHDYHLSRLTDEHGPVRQRSAAELQDIALGRGRDRIELLPAILDEIDGKVPVLIELKDQDGAMGPNTGALERSVVAALAQYSGPVALMSFNPHTVHILAELCPDIPRGLVTSSYNSADWPLSAAVCDRLRTVPDFDTSGSGFVSHQADDLNNPRVAELKAQGATILCWTITSQADADDALKIADNITFEGFLPA